MDDARHLKKCEGLTSADASGSCIVYAFHAPTPLLVKVGQPGGCGAPNFQRQGPRTQASIAPDPLGKLSHHGVIGVDSLRKMNVLPVRRPIFRLSQRARLLNARSRHVPPAATLTSYRVANSVRKQ